MTGDLSLLMDNVRRLERSEEEDCDACRVAESSPPSTVVVGDRKLIWLATSLSIEPLQIPRDRT